MRNFNIFSDAHHADLFYSFQLLFEKRLGYSLFKPIGMEWADEGWWQIHKPYNYNPDTAKQYLQIKPEYIPKDGTLSLNKVSTETIRHDLCGKKPIDIFIVEDKHNNTFHKAITLEQFKEMDIDIIIASIPDHWYSFTKLRNKYKPNAKIICHAGNHFIELDNAIRNGTVKNLMASLSPFPVSINSVFYHQEFSTDIFKPSFDAIKKQITSFINVLPMNGGSANYYALKACLPDFEFRSYGASCDDRVINTTEEIANIMRQSMFTFMVKSGADGYGFNLHESFACGTPVIINYDEYKDKLGGKLLIPDETCLVANIGDTMQDVANKIMNMTEVQYMFMRQKTYEISGKMVNFDEEEKQIREFLDKLS